MHPATYRQEFGWICMGSFLIFSRGIYIHNSHAVAGSSAKGNQIQICVFHCQNDDEEIIFQMSPTQNLNHKQDLAIGELETALLEKHFLWMGEQKIQGKWSGINQGTGWDGFASSSSKAWPWHVWFVRGSTNAVSSQGCEETAFPSSHVWDWRGHHDDSPFVSSWTIGGLDKDVRLVQLSGCVNFLGWNIAFWLVTTYNEAVFSKSSLRL